MAAGDEDTVLLINATNLKFHCIPLFLFRFIGFHSSSSIWMFIHIPSINSCIGCPWSSPSNPPDRLLTNHSITLKWDSENSVKTRKENEVFSSVCKSAGSKKLLAISRNSINVMRPTFKLWVSAAILASWFRCRAGCGLLICSPLRAELKSRRVIFLYHLKMPWKIKYKI